MKKLAVIMFVAMMAFVMLTGCGGGKESEEISEVSSESSSDMVSETVSEEVSETVSETTTEEISEEASEEEVDYSADAVIALVDTLIAKYSDENQDYIKALVIAMNMEYMSDADFETVMTTYGYTMEQLNENFVGVLDMKYECYHQRELYLDGAIDEYVNRYEDSIMISETCLNSDEITYYSDFEGMIDDFEELDSQRIAVIENYTNSKKDYIVYMITTDPVLRERIIEGFNTYDNFISKAAEN